MAPFHRDLSHVYPVLNKGLPWRRSVHIEDLVQVADDATACAITTGTPPVHYWLFASLRSSSSRARSEGRICTVVTAGDFGLCEIEYAYLFNTVRTR